MIGGNMGVVFTDLTMEDLCDLMCGGPEPEEDEEWEEEVVEAEWLAVSPEAGWKAG